MMLSNNAFLYIVLLIIRNNFGDNHFFVKFWKKDTGVDYKKYTSPFINSKGNQFKFPCGPKTNIILKYCTVFQELHSKNIFNYWPRKD